MNGMQVHITVYPEDLLFLEDRFGVDVDAVFSMTPGRRTFRPPVSVVLHRTQGSGLRIEGAWVDDVYETIADYRAQVHANGRAAANGKTEHERT